MPARRIAEGLAGGEAFGVDPSLIQADAHREDGIASERWPPEAHASRAATEDLETLDDAASSAATPVAPKRVSPLDPAARRRAADRGKAHVLYSADDRADAENARGGDRADPAGGKQGRAS